MDVNIRLYYLRLPVNVIYKFDLGKSVQVFAGTGLYFARGLWGKENGQLTSEGFGTSVEAINNNVKFVNEASPNFTDPVFTPYDFGYNVLVGIEWNQLKLTSGISNGLIKAYSGFQYDTWNSAFSVYITYKFATIR